MSRAVVAILGIVLVGVIGIYAAQAGLANASEDRTVDNETWTPTVGVVTELDHSNQTGATYGGEVDIWDENGTVMTNGTDYEWYDGNGTVKALAGGGLDGDSTATITYGFQQTSEEQRALAGIVAMLPRALGILIPLLGVALLFAFLKG